MLGIVSIWPLLSNYDIERTEYPKIHSRGKEREDGTSIYGDHEESYLRNETTRVSSVTIELVGFGHTQKSFSLPHLRLLSYIN